jgi:REP element-mobilizing transposase RayT
MARKQAFNHLHRLDQVWVEPAIYFVTTCVAERAPVLANDFAAGVLHGQFAQAPRRYGWRVGRYVIMPDHIHFFCAPGGERDPSSLSVFVGGVKMWSARSILAVAKRKPPLWQGEFFDRLLRSDESYESKWAYVRDNPVRGGLVEKAEDWPHAGEIEPLSF